MTNWKIFCSVFLVACLLVGHVPVAMGKIASEGLSRAEWAQNLPNGSLRAVFLAPYGAQHDSFELMQRFDVDGTVVEMSSLDIHGYIDWGFRIVGHYWPDLLPTREEVLGKIQGALSTNWETIVMSGTPPWYRYPQDIRRSILEKIASGRGLMIGGLDDTLIKDIEAMGLQLEKTEIGADRFTFLVGDNGGYLGHARVYRCGEGHVTHFHANNHPAHGYLLSASPLQSDFEFSAARAGWFLHRTARPGVHSYLIGTRFDDRRVEVKLDAAVESLVDGVQIAVHHRGTYEKVLDVTKNMQPGEPIVVKLPQLSTGEYQAEVRVKDSVGRTVDWDAKRFTVSGRLRFEQLEINQTEVRPGDTINCRLVVEGKTSGLQTTARWYDNWNRLLLSTEPRPFSQPLQVPVPSGSLSVLNRLEVTILSDRGPEAVRSAELLISENIRPTDFHMLYWKLDVEKRYAPDSWRRRIQWDTLRRDGAADAWANGYAYLNEARDAALCHLRTLPMTTSLHAMNLEKELLNEESLANREKGVREAARVFRPYNPLGHTLGDENFVHYQSPGRFADTPEVWAKFREYLRKIYPDLALLNVQWESDFGTWDKIRFDNEGQMLTNMDNPSAWVDYRMFVTQHFVNVHRRMRQAIREEDPDTWVGWDGAEKFSSYSGIDWWEMCRDMEILNTYHIQLVPDEQHPWKLFNGESIGSFGRHAKLRGCWINAANREYGGQYVPWYLALNGWNSVWWWQATFLHPANGPLRWDLGLTPVAKPMATAVQEIKAGPGTLLAHAHKQISPIAVHYSATNWHASTIESGVAHHVGNLGIGVAFWMAPTVAARVYADDEMKQIWGGIAPKGHSAVASANFYTLLHDSGFEPRTMARQEIESDTLTTSHTQLLILPFVVSLSDLEVEKIREFVKRGGVLLADYRCGLRDSHGRLRDTPALDDVFGIRRESLEVRRGRATLAVDIAGGSHLDTVFHDPVVRTEAEASGYHDDGTQAFFVHPYGQGQAVYLNTDLYGYIDLRRRGQEQRLRKLFANLLVRVNHLYPPFPIQQKNGTFPGPIEVTHFEDGNTHYYGLLPAFDIDDRAPRSVRLPFPEQKHIYDVRAQKYLGHGGPIDATVVPGEPKMYAALPYKVKGLSISVPAAATRGEPIEITITVNATNNHSGPHAVRLEATLPNDRKLEYLATTLYLPSGRATWSFVPALNAPAGLWTISGTEAVSAAHATAKILVK